VAEYEGVDALLAAITDEAPPEGAGDDPEFMAEHRSAVRRKRSRSRYGPPESAPAAPKAPRGTAAAVP
jgi:hypothetical protein